MRLGIFSDTHDEYEWMRHAIAALDQHGEAFVVHCGDIGSPRMLDLFIIRPNQRSAAFVFGNSDDQRASLEQRAIELGITCLREFGEFQLAGKHFALTHGDDRYALRAVLRAQEYDYLLCGHTHHWRDKRVGRTRIINPGPAALHVERRPLELPTCAVLDVETDRLEKINLS